MHRLSWFSSNLNPILFVPQQEVYLIERFGRFNREKGGGPLFKFPIVERVAGRQGLSFYEKPKIKIIISSPTHNPRT